MSKKKKIFAVSAGVLVVLLGALVAFFTVYDSRPEGHPDTGDLACETCHGKTSPPQAASLPEKVAGQAAGSLAYTKWLLVSFGQPGAEQPVTGDAAITLAFYTEGQAGGSGSCNAYHAPYDLQGDILSFGVISSTLDTCEPASIGQQEQGYFQALGSVGRYELSGDWLTIGYADGQGVLNWVKSPDPLP